MRPKKRHSLSYRSPETRTSRDGQTPIRNQIAAAAGSVWFILKNVFRWLYELSNWVVP